MALLKKILLERKKIDQIDQKIARLLTQRKKKVQKVQELKVNAGKKLRDRSREKKVLAHYKKVTGSRTTKLQKLVQAVISYCLD